MYPSKNPAASGSGSNVISLFGANSPLQHPFRRFTSIVGASIDRHGEDTRLTLTLQIAGKAPLATDFLKDLTVTLRDPSQSIELTVRVSAYAVDGTSAMLRTTRLENVYEGTVFGAGSTLELKGRADETLRGPLVTLLLTGTE